ncbi:MAG: hypothetical protein KBT67_00835 [bacterium]|nr:hypothetical protein [Candidatus Limimorpha caballi]
MQKIKITTIILWCLLIAFGWVFGLLVRSLSWFEYDNSFNLFDLIYFIFTGGIALFITSRIEESLQARRGQKDIILQKIDEVDERIKELTTDFKQENNRYTIGNFELLLKVKQFGMLASHYEKSIAKYYPELTKDKQFSKISSARKFVKICTSDGDAERAVCVDDKWSYSQDKFVEIVTELNRLSQICFTNKLLLNKA